MSRTISKLVFAVLLASLLAPWMLVRVPVEAQSGPCSQHSGNLIKNGSIDTDSVHGTQHGLVADNWESFVLSGSPRFALVTNENANGDIRSSAQYIYSDKHPFDAGIYQIVTNVQPGVYYSAKVGQALAAVDYGDGHNSRNGDIGRRVGVDPLGGVNPNAPSVVWGNEFHDLNPALNIPDLTILVAAQSNRMTVFVRAIDHNSSGLSKIWFDVVCLKPDYSKPTAVPLAPIATPLPPTATPVPPTNTPRPVVVRAPNTPTKIAQAPTNTPIPAELRAPDTATPTNTGAPTGTPRYARPDVTPTAGAPIDLGTGIVALMGLLLVGGAVAFFGIGILWWMRVR